MSTDLARKLRAEPTEPERAMWRILHPLRRAGYHFRRQVEIGTYHVDFACHRPAVVIEVDGDTHGTSLTVANDATRDDYLSGRGYRVLRFWNNAVMRNAEGVYRAIAAVLSERAVTIASPTLDPSPRRGRETTEAPPLGDHNR